MSNEAIEPKWLVGVNEIAEFYGVDETAVRRWKRIYDDFPPPVKRLAMGVIFDMRQVAAFMTRNGLPGSSLAGKRRGKITPVQRQEMLRRIKRGDLTQAQASREYGVSEARVSQLMKTGA